MFIKHFAKKTWREKSPVNPGHSVTTYQWTGSGTTKIVHGEREYEADDNGWIDAPPDVVETYLRMHVTVGRGDQSTWMTQPDAQAQVRAGFMDEAESVLGRVVVPVLPRPRLVAPPRPVARPRPTPAPRRGPANRGLGDDGARPPSAS